MGVIDKNLQNLWVIGAALLVGGVIMWAVDCHLYPAATLDMEKMTIPQAIWIGLVQVLSAVFPGTSRSMGTIAAGQTGGILPRGRPGVFLLPLHSHHVRRHRAGALRCRRGKIRPASACIITAHQWGVLIVGFVVSFIVAWR